MNDKMDEVKELLEQRKERERQQAIDAIYLKLYGRKGDKKQPIAFDLAEDIKQETV
jgi:hypothetical protein